MDDFVGYEWVSSAQDQGWQSPARFYADPEIHKLEQDAIFKKSWQFVCRESELANPGDYVTAQLGQVPILVIRGASGELHGHVNVCRHRLHPVAEGKGCKQILQCKYHGWTFTPEGDLRAAPGLQNEPGFDRSKLGLIPIRLGIFRGFVFANANMDAEDLGDYVENANAICDEFGLDIAGWESAGSFHYDIDADWKLFVENSLECYHCPLVHQDTFAHHIGSTEAEYITREFTNILTQIAPVNLGPDGKSLPNAKGFRLLFIWPNTFISADDFVGVVARSVPNGPQKTRFTVDAFTRPGVDKADVDEWAAMYDRTFAEDKAVVNAQQIGYNSGMVPQGRLMGHREASIKMFQSRTWEALQGAPRSAAKPAVKAAPPAPPEIAAPGLIEARVDNIRDVADGVREITLVSAKGGDLPAWRPGAHLDIHLGNGLTRQYSLCGDADDAGAYTIAVLREPKSRGGSEYVHADLLTGADIRIGSPRNHFSMPDEGSMLFIAGGVGITPILSMIRQAEKHSRNWRLIYAGRSLATMAYADFLTTFGDRVTLVPADTHGIMDLSAVVAGVASGSHICSCGPLSLLDALEDTCASRTDVALHIERFKPKEVEHLPNTAFEVELRRSGTTVQVAEDETILDAVRRAGVTAFSSCAAGVCGTCETAVISGAPEHRDSILSQKERDSGNTMMICVSRAKSSRLVLDI